MELNRNCRLFELKNACYSGIAGFQMAVNFILFQVDVGANGYYGYEVMDTCRPVPDSEAGDADLSLLSYLDCCENSFLEYQKRVEGSDYAKSFGYLAFHMQALKIKEQLDKRHELSMDEYDELLKSSSVLKFGTRNVIPDTHFIPQARSTHGKERCFFLSYPKEMLYISQSPKREV